MKPNEWKDAQFVNHDHVRGCIFIQCRIDVILNCIPKIMIEDTSLMETDKRRWQSKILSSLESLLSSQKFADMKLLVEDKEINVHKAIMISRSSVFEAMLEHDTVERRDNTVEIVEFRYETILELVHFIYTGSVKRLNEDDSLAMELLAAADKYDLEDLIILCSKHLIATINVENAVDMLVIADRHGLAELKLKAIEFMHSNRDEICKPRVLQN